MDIWKKILNLSGNGLEKVIFYISIEGRDKASSGDRAI
jgi:hypothetical protein